MRKDRQAGPIVTADEIREMDRVAIEELGLPGVVLMETAGRGAARVALSELASSAARGPVAILCGGGNNGGDGYVVARCLLSAGVPCTVYLATPPARVGGDARLNLDLLRKLPVPVVEVPDEAAARAAEGALREAAVVVDALLGTGLRSEVRGVLRALIDLANAGRGRRVAVDIPSGVHADTGAVLGAAFEAHATVTFAHPKLGLVLHPGAAHAGDVHTVDIGIPPQVTAQVGWRADAIGAAEVRAALPRRPRTGHKGTFGHCLVLAGAPGKGGAALLAGRAALAGGSGLVTVATDREVQARLEGRVPELMVEWFRDDAGGEVDAERLEGLLAGKAAAVIGPGLGATSSTESLVLRAARLSDVPVVVDADGLNVLASHPGALAETRRRFVLTPHPGEMARLLGRSTAEIQADRPAAARQLAARENAVVVLKGARTLVARPDGHVGVNLTGNPGMGTAGTGDVLAGLIGALLAQGLQEWEAARCAVRLHGEAGDEAARSRGERALVAGDLLAALGAVLRRVEQEVSS